MKHFFQLSLFVAVFFAAIIVSCEDKVAPKIAPALDNEITTRSFSSPLDWLLGEHSRQVDVPCGGPRRNCNCWVRIDDVDGADAWSVSGFYDCIEYNCNANIIGLDADPCAPITPSQLGVWYPFNCKPPAVPLGINYTSLNYLGQDCETVLENILGGDFCQYLVSTTAQISFKCIPAGQLYVGNEPDLTIEVTSNPDGCFGNSFGREYISISSGCMVAQIMQQDPITPPDPK